MERKRNNLWDICNKCRIYCIISFNTKCTSEGMNKLNIGRQWISYSSWKKKVYEEVKNCLKPFESVENLKSIPNCQLKTHSLITNTILTILIPN